MNQFRPSTTLWEQSSQGAKRAPFAKEKALGTNLLKRNQNTLKLLSFKWLRKCSRSSEQSEVFEELSEIFGSHQDAFGDPGHDTGRKSYAFDSDEVGRYKVTSMMSTRQSELLLALNQSNQLG